MDETESFKEDKPAKLDLESIAGLTWLGVLVVGAVVGSAYGIYTCLPHPVQQQIERYVNYSSPQANPDVETDNSTTES